MKFSAISISLLLLILLVHNSSFAQDRHFQQDTVLVGKVSRMDLQFYSFGENFLTEYRQYEPDQSVLNSIKDKIYSYDITMVLGTWCSDSKLQVPRFFKILDLLNYNTQEITIYAVDREKKCDGIDLTNLDIELVPTFIISQNGKERGRIVETPLQTLEKDISSILIK